MAQRPQHPPLQQPKEAGERYQQALAMRAAELGYAIVPSRNGTFELDGVPREIALMFSSRAKAVEARLAEQGLTRASATLEQREDAALRTRSAKPEIDRVAQRARTGRWPATPAWIWSGSSLKPNSAPSSSRSQPATAASTRKATRGQLAKSRPYRRSRHCARCARRRKP